MDIRISGEVVGFSEFRGEDFTGGGENFGVETPVGARAML